MSDSKRVSVGTIVTVKHEGEDVQGIVCSTKSSLMDVRLSSGLVLRELPMGDARGPGGEALTKGKRRSKPTLEGVSVTPARRKALLGDVDETSYGYVVEFIEREANGPSRVLVLSPRPLAGWGLGEEVKTQHSKGHKNLPTGVVLAVNAAGVSEAAEGYTGGEKRLPVWSA